MKTVDEKLESLKQEKCIVGDCGEKQGMFLTIPTSPSMGEIVPFCMPHAIRFMELAPKWDKKSKEIEKLLMQSDGSTVRINNHQEFLNKVKPLFIEITQQALPLTKGKCIKCGKIAVGIISFLNPVCEAHIGYPRDVLKVALK